MLSFLNVYLLSLKTIKIVFPGVFIKNLFSDIYFCKSILLENKMQQGGNLNTSRVGA